MIAIEETVDWHGFRAYPWNLPDPHWGGYLFTNIVKPDKHYVGIAGLRPNKTLETRGIEHSRMGKSVGRKFQNALKKYGCAGFLVEPLFHWIFGPVINKELLEFESQWIAAYDSVKNGYNTLAASGPDANYGKEFGDLIRAALADPETKARQKANQLTAFAQPGMREKRSLVSKAVHADPAIKAKHKANMIITNTRPEVREKRRRAVALMHSDPDLRRRIGESVKELWANDPDRKQQAAHTMLEMRQSPGALAEYQRVKGSIWIASGTEEYRIRPDELIPEGWRRGRLPYKRQTVTVK